VKEVALRCGFADEKYFSRLFKNTYGITPEEYRKAHRVYKNG
jgi:two-component system response regulator YesN